MAPITSSDIKGIMTSLQNSTATIPSSTFLMTNGDTFNICSVGDAFYFTGSNTARTSSEMCERIGFYCTHTAATHRRFVMNEAADDIISVAFGKTINQNPHAAYRNYKLQHDANLTGNPQLNAFLSLLGPRPDGAAAPAPALLGVAQATAPVPAQPPAVLAPPVFTAPAPLALPLAQAPFAAPAIGGVVGTIAAPPALAPAAVGTIPAPPPATAGAGFQTQAPFPGSVPVTLAPAMPPAPGHVAASTRGDVSRLFAEVQHIQVTAPPAALTQTAVNATALFDGMYHEVAKKDVKGYLSHLALEGPTWQELVKYLWSVEADPHQQRFFHAWFVGIAGAIQGGWRVESSIIRTLDSAQNEIRPRDQTIEQFDWAAAMNAVFAALKRYDIVKSTMMVQGKY